MKKTEFIATMAEKLDITKAKSSETVQAFLDCLAETLKTGESVSFPGFGSFSVYERPERQGRNPRTGEPLTIKAKKGVKFKAGKGLDLVT